MNEVYNLTCHIIYKDEYEHIAYIWTKPFSSFRKAESYAKRFSKEQNVSWPEKKKWSKEEDEKRMISTPGHFFVIEQQEIL
jgi:hypothetical protein